MVQKNKRTTCLAFTIIELLTIIVIIAILTTVGAIVYTNVQKSSRDHTRNTSVTVLAEALEKYYNKNGEYPSCGVLQADPNLIAQNVLIGIDTRVFKAPRSGSEVVNSIICNDISSTSSDVYAYVYESGGWILQYRSEESGGVVEIKSRHHQP